MKRIDAVGLAGVSVLSLLPLAARVTDSSPSLETLSSAAVPGVVSAMVAIAGYLGARVVYRSAPDAAFVATLLVLLLFWPGWIASLGSRLAEASYDTWAPRVLGTLLVLAGAGWIWMRGGRMAEAVPRGLLTFGTVLLVLQVVGWRDAPVPTSVLDPPDLESPVKRPPDVYFLILDQYTGRTALSRNYGLDISGFEDELRGRGFVVPTTSRANYALTITSLASMLNWTYLNGLEVVDPDSRKYSDMYPLIEANRTLATFHRLGYEIHFFPTPYHGTRRNRTADVEWLPPGRKHGDQLQVDWILGTAFGVTLRWYCRTRGCGGPDREAFPYAVETAEEQKWKFDVLPTLSSADGRPLFVFVHFLLPHEPYIVGRDCQPIDPIWPLSGDDPRIAALYPEQIECLNGMLLELIDALLDRPTGPPVIILQSDHGHGRLFIDLQRGFRSREEAGVVRVAERFAIFAAYRVPGLSWHAMTDTVTPVNVVPLMLNSLFDAEIPLQENRGYWSVYRRPYAFERQF